MKITIISIVIIVILTVVFFFYMKNAEQSDQAIQTCVNGLVNENIDTDFAARQIIVKFNEDVDTLEEMKNIIEKHDGLIVEGKIGQLGAALVDVPINREFEWICRLQNINKVEFAQLNYLMETH